MFREKQSLELHYGSTDTEFGICITQHPVHPNKQVFLSFNEDSDIVATKRQVCSLVNTGFIKL